MKLLNVDYHLSNKRNMSCFQSLQQSILFLMAK
ncbi:Uncharacterised protein [Parabacteroides merdae]|nr:Uncharacterised protein [Parabacteroides merdae]